MFRRLGNSLEPDPSFPTDLKQLGFFINTLGQVRSIDAPEKPYYYRATNNERVNNVREEAVRKCIRDDVEKRLAALGLHRLYLPGLAISKPTTPSVPILAPPLHILKARKRVTIVINDSDKDLGILTWHQVQRAGINNGSLVSFGKEMVQRAHLDSGKYAELFDDGNGVQDDNDTPALVVLNPGQLLYSHKNQKAMTLRSWNAMPRKSAAHDMVCIHDENRIAGHETPMDHIRTAFDVLLANSDYVMPSAEIYIVAMGDGADNLLTMLEKDFSKNGPRITGLALVNCLMDGSQMHVPELQSLLHRRARHWKGGSEDSDPLRCISLPNNFNEHSTTTPALQDNGNTTDHPDAICPTFASQSEFMSDNVFVNAFVQRAVLSFFEEIAAIPSGFCNAGLKVDAHSASVDNPLDLSLDVFLNSNSESMPPEMLPGQQEISMARKELEEMCLARDACPGGLLELHQGLQKLAIKISKKEAEVAQLSTKALTSRGLPAGEAQEDRENWKPEKEGTKVPFAGTMVDSELLKAAGFLETAEMELNRSPENA